MTASRDLLSAVQTRDVDAVKGALDAGAKVNVPGFGGRTAVHVAAEAGDAEVMRMILSKKGRVNTEDDDGNQPLHIACDHNHTDVALLLLKKKAEVTIPNKIGSYPLIIASQKGNLSVVKALIKAKANVKAQDTAGITALHAVAAAGHGDILAVLLKAKAPPASKDSDGWTPLHWACKNGFEPVARSLIEAGAKVDDQGKEGDTPLHLASNNGQLECVQLLIEKRAKVDLKDSAWAGGDGITAATALHLAAMENHTEIVRVLLEARADFKEKTGEGSTALDLAVRYNCPGPRALLAEIDPDAAPVDAVSASAAPSAGAGRRYGQLAADLRFRTGEWSDVVLKSGDGEEFCAHRAMLAVRYPSLANCVEQPEEPATVLGATGEPIEGVDPESDVSFGKKITNFFRGRSKTVSSPQRPENTKNKSGDSSTGSVSPAKSGPATPTGGERASNPFASAATGGADLRSKNEDGVEIIHLRELNARTLGPLVEWIYTDRMDVGPDTLAVEPLLDLLSVLQTSQVLKHDTLAAIVEEEARARVTASTLSDMLEASHARHVDTLYQYCLGYFAERRERLMETINLPKTREVVEALMRPGPASIPALPDVKPTLPADMATLLRRGNENATFVDGYLRVVGGADDLMRDGADADIPVKDADVVRVDLAAASGNPFLHAERGMLRVHRFVLAARCNFLADTFTGSDDAAVASSLPATLVGSPSTIAAKFKRVGTLSPRMRVPAGTLGKLMSFLYTGVIPKDLTMDDALYLTPRLQALTLTDPSFSAHCSEILDEGLSHSNVLEVYQIVNTMDDRWGQSLAAKCLAMLSENLKLVARHLDDIEWDISDLKSIIRAAADL